MTLKPISDLHQKIAWLVLALLLLLRIPYTIAIIYWLPIENQLGGAIYEISTYFLTAGLIWWERDRLADYHIDGLALFLIISLRPLQTLILNFWKVDSPLAFPHPLGLVIWGISLSLLIAFAYKGFKPTRVTRGSLNWLVVGILIGTFISIGENMHTFSSMLSNARASQISLLPILSSTSLNLVYHLGFAPINEEPLFRGFLWGYLRQLKWREVSIWFFQAVLFTSAHVYFAKQYPVMFWVFIPGAALALGLLTWRARSIAPAMLAHGLINGSAYLLIAILVRLSL